MTGDSDDELDGPPTGRFERPKPAVRAISMKPPMASAPEKPAPRRPEVKLVPPVTTTMPAPEGRLAPPRDQREARARRVRDMVVWGSIAVIVASIVALAIWLIAGH